VGDVCHRIWAVRVEESFVFNTKERVPFMLCLEVLDYPSNHLELCKAALVHLEGQQSSVDIENSSTAVYANARVVKYAKDCLSSSDKTQTLDTDFGEGVNECLNYFSGTNEDCIPPPASFSSVIDIDPYFGERWQDKESRIRQSSRVGHLRGWRLLPCMVKSGDDLRQEQFASYIIKQMHEIYQQCGVDCWTRPYDVVALSPDSGLIEVI
jgi:phosphatidylinositol kinase/protein kinase (PI-3  family)